MVKSSRLSYVCQNCGAVSSRWAGKCDSCGAWNSLLEEASDAVVPKGLSVVGNGKGRGGKLEIHDLQSQSEILPREKTGIGELDRVTGGGLVRGAAMLIGGDPGIGKSTLLLQAVCALARQGKACLYVSGEEAVDQIRMRAGRLGLADVNIALAASSSVRDILSAMDGAIDLVVIDSIQTMFVDNIDSAPGTVTQVRTSALELIRTAKKKNIILFLVGHVTKDGQIAGPRVLEHMVDTVLYFEGDRGHQFRILRAVKNRFGPTDEIGVFEMAEKGLEEVANPSALFLSQKQENIPGNAVFAGMEGTRPVLVEVQGLAASTAYGTPRRAVVGWDSGRLAMILAVLEARVGLNFSGYDVFLNMAGGIRVSEPAADLAVAAALMSALSNKTFPANTIFFGEVGLSGEVRAAPQTDLRLKEAEKLGFKMAVLPQNSKIKSSGGLRLEKVRHVQDLAALLAV
ncbi:MAG: DNA repair protein RadA [Rhodospirillales bacterium]|nr:DNA repair protein RadA [Rhodospirillales bacterium]MCB9965613.1 DNA repair protein RadA [Rhodospirillales bacterium]MCB9973036.1 DNA repair protein RadA [Rhodospirillales bacterium]